MRRRRRNDVHGPRKDLAIDYVVVNEVAKEKIHRFLVEERVKADHQPVVIEVRREWGGGIEKMR